MAKQGEKKQKMVRESAPSGKNVNIAGKGKRIPTGPPGSPQGQHHTAMAKDGTCLCGRCSNERIAA